MNGQQFLKEIMDIPGVTYVQVNGHKPRPVMIGDRHRVPGHTEITLTCVGPYGEEANVCIKHGAALFAYEAAVNLATQFCTQPVL
jgi:hypothetical protein